MDTSSTTNKQEIDQRELAVIGEGSSTDPSSLLREEHGRIFNTTSDSYILPSDNAEWLRLDKQHTALKMACNGLYPCSDIIEATLQHTGEAKKQILDIGCGTGAWAIEMATKFPHAVVTAIDLAPLPHDPSKLPPNFRFSIMDINDGLSKFHGQLFDLIQSRCMVSGVKDIKKTIRELQLALKPGSGILLMIEGDAELEDAQDHKVKMAKIDGDEDVSGISEDGSLFRRMFFEGIEASILSGAETQVALDLIDHGLWDQSLLDPDTAINGAIYLPIGPWTHSDIQEEDETLKRIGTLTQEVILSIHRAWHPMLFRHGVAQDILDDWSRRVDEEFKTTTPRVCLRFRFCCARKRAGEGLPALPLSLSKDEAEINHSEANRPTLCVSHGHPSAIVTYHTPEGAWSAWEKRRESVGVKPEALVKKIWRSRQRSETKVDA